MFSPAILAFDVEADLQVCAVNRPVSILASFIVFLIHLAIASLDTSLNGFAVEIKSAGSDDLVNLCMHNVLNWSKHTLKARFLMYVWPFDNNMHGRVNLMHR